MRHKILYIYFYAESKYSLMFMGLLGTEDYTGLMKLSSTSIPNDKMNLELKRDYSDINISISDSTFTSRDVIMNIEEELKKRPVLYDFYIILNQKDYQSLMQKNTPAPLQNSQLPKTMRFFKYFEMKVARNAP
jgi:hypothetical protein